MRTALVTLTMCLVALPANAKYSGGTGEPNDPYQIATAADLIALGETPEDYDKHFILTADIDLDPNLPGRKVFDKAVIAPASSVSISPYVEETAFTGSFDGHGYTIVHLSIIGGGYLGLFGHLDSPASVFNVSLDGVEVHGTGDGVGGLVGCNNGGSIAMSYSSGVVSGRSDVGGLVGYNYRGCIVMSRSNGLVSGTGDANSYVGGLVGRNYASISTSYSNASVSGGWRWLGVNWHYGSIGGLVGYNAGSITASHSNGSVNGTSLVGGLVGCNAGRVAASYSTASVSGTASVGGLVGLNNGSIATTYSSGSVSGTERVGGLVGHNPWGSTSSSFWDIETSGQSTSAAGTGKTTVEMRKIETFLSAGWDFINEVSNGICDYWQMSPGEYPQLHYHGNSRPLMPEGLGTAEQPYLIRDAADLGTVWFEPMAHYRLAQSVDLSGITWSIGVIPWFAGSFDGNGCVITDLHIQGGSYLGLFAELGSLARVCNLGMEAVDVNGTGGYIGGLVGYNRGGHIGTSYATGSVSGTGNHVGGLVGCNSGGHIVTSYSSAFVSGTDNVGGLIGVDRWGGAVTRCYSTGGVNGRNYVGGLIGCNWSWDEYRGGPIRECYTSGSISGGLYVGGLVGQNGVGITASHSVATVTGKGCVGGLVGVNEGGVTTSYSTGVTSGDGTVGGLAGWNGGTVSQCYSSGAVKGGSNVGGLVGVSNGCPGTACFWDIQTSGQATSDGGTGKTTAEMQMAKAFLDAGWDFVGEAANGAEDMWWIFEGRDYPRLWWERVLEDDFEDGEAGPLWFVYAPEPELVQIEEVNGRLETTASAEAENVDAFYVADGWRLDATKDFAIRVDFHFSRQDGHDGRVTLGVVPGLDPSAMQWAELEAGCFDTGPFYLYEVRDGSWVQERVIDRFVDEGTLYMSYNSEADELYFSQKGYGKANAWGTVPGLLKGRWKNEPVYIILGGGSEGMALTGEDAWLDNLVVNSGTLILSEPDDENEPDEEEPDFDAD